MSISKENSHISTKHTSSSCQEEEASLKDSLHEVQDSEPRQGERETEREYRDEYDDDQRRPYNDDDYYYDDRRRYDDDGYYDRRDDRRDDDYYYDDRNRRYDDDRRYEDDYDRQYYDRRDDEYYDRERRYYEEEEDSKYENIRKARDDEVYALEEEVKGLQETIESLKKENEELKAKTTTVSIAPPPPIPEPPKMMEGMEEIKKRASVLEYEKKKLIQLLKDAQQQLLHQKKEIGYYKELSEKGKEGAGAGTKEGVTTTSAGTDSKKETVATASAVNVSAGTKEATAKDAVNKAEILTSEVKSDKPSNDYIALTEKYQQLEKQRITESQEYQKKMKQMKDFTTKEINKIKDQAKKLIKDIQTEKQGKVGKRLDTVQKVLQSQLRPSFITLRTEVQTNLKSMQTEIQSQFKTLSKELQKQAKEKKLLLENYEKSIAERRLLYNQLQEAKGNIRVLCRLRPLTADEESCTIVKLTSEEIQLSASNKEKSWELDKIFAGNVKQLTIFEEISPLITSILDGYNICIFAYGQTGSGKTFTMLGTTENPGMNVLSLHELSRCIALRSNEYEDEMMMSMLEIYNEDLVDLLVTTTKDAPALAIRQTPNGKTYVQNLTTVKVSTYQDIELYMKQGETKRSISATDMNEHSSRSHTILSITVTSKHKLTQVVTQGKLHLIDLAGSERVSKSGATGQRLKEAQNINKSLSALGDVIAARASKQKHVPYRNSTLTYLLQDSLSGDSKTLMMACISPNQNNIEETFCTLNFASRVKLIEMGKATKTVLK